MMIVLDTFHVMRHHHLTLKLITIFQLPFLIFRPRLCSPWSCFKGFITTLQTRHQRLAILDTAGLHSGDGGDTFTLQLLWGSKCFVGLRYEYHPRYHFILRLKPVWNIVYLFSLGPIVFFETFLQCARFFRWILAPVSHFKLQLGRKCFGFSVGFLIPKTNVFFPRWLFPWPMSLLTFYPLFVLDSEWQERFVYLRPVEHQCLV